MLGALESIWLVTYKEALPDTYVSASEVLDEALCFGWMDGRRKVLDGEIVPRVACRLRLDGARHAHELLGRAGLDGKVVLVGHGEPTTPGPTLAQARPGVS